MDTQKAYKTWAEQYDTNENKTRDREAQALMTLLQPARYHNCLEIGCGTGKNTTWLAEHCSKVTAVDFSVAMLELAQQKVTAANVQFMSADITKPWQFAQGEYDLITFSLVLEHIRDLQPVFATAAKHLAIGGMMYVGELHPFKQYSGSKARFEKDGEIHMPDCFTHNVSEYYSVAAHAGLKLENLQEFFDEQDGHSLPRILVMLFRKA